MSLKTWSRAAVAAGVLICLSACGGGGGGANDSGKPAAGIVANSESGTPGGTGQQPSGSQDNGTTSGSGNSSSSGPGGNTDNGSGGATGTTPNPGDTTAGSGSGSAGGTTSPGTGGSAGGSSGGASSGAGSSSGGNTGNTGETAAIIQFSPSAIRIVVGQATGEFFSVTATLTSPISQTVYPMITDMGGAVNLNSRGNSIIQTSASTYTARLLVPAGLSLGHHPGSLYLHLCLDDVCRTELAGSPIALPYDIKAVDNVVRDAIVNGAVTTLPSEKVSDLGPLSPWSGVSEWGTYRGNAQHSGYVPVQLNANNFRYRWTWTGAGEPVSSIATGNGKIYFSGCTYSGGTCSLSPSKLVALNEQDGTVAWQLSQPFSNHTVGVPAYDNGQLYVQTSSGLYGNVFSINAATMAVNWKTPFSTQDSYYMAPTVFQGKVYTRSGLYNGVSAYSSSTGAELFFTIFGVGDAWAPAVDVNGIHTYTCGSTSGDCEYRFLNRSTGALVDSFRYSNEYFYNVYGRAVLISAIPDRVIVRGDNYFIASLDSKTKLAAWAVSGRYLVDPVLAQGVLYACKEAGGGTVVEARSEASGTLAWSWAGGSGACNDLIVTNNMLLASTGGETVAIDLATHQAVWRYPLAGQLALSARGVLYIQGDSLVDGVSDSVIKAISLK